MNAGYSLGAFVVILWGLALGLFRWACFLLLVLITFWMWTDDGTHPETRAWVSRNIFTPVVETIIKPAVEWCGEWCIPEEGES